MREVGVGSGLRCVGRGLGGLSLPKAIAGVALAVPVALALAALIGSQPGVAAEQREGAAASSGLAPLALAAAVPRVPVQPQNPSAAKAFVVLETYCARCHQSGRSPVAGRGLAGGFANVLQLEEVSRIPSLVRPGIPDASQIYIRMLQNHVGAMQADEPPPAEPTAGEIDAVRDWIQDLPQQGPTRAAACSDRAVQTGEELASQMQRWLQQVGPAVARDTRFVSIAHLANDCATEGELAAYRQAVVKIFGSLSWSEARVVLDTVGDSLTLLAVRLSDLGWLPVHWEKLAANYAGGDGDAVPPAIVAATGTPVPLLRGDWLASAAMRAPLYYDLIGLPQSLQDLARLMSLDLDTGRSRAGTRRLGVRTSQVTLGPRVIERQAAISKLIWLAYDFPAGDGGKAFDHPLGPSADGSNRSAVRPDGARLVFSLPNGLPGYAVFDSDGNRIDRALSPRTPAEPADARGTTPGLGCVSCHTAGLVDADDEMRTHVDSDKFAGDRDARAAALALYPPMAEMRRLFDDDRAKFRRALTSAGIDPDLTLHGLDIMSALARQYERDLDVGRAAAEFGLDAAAFIERLKSYDGSEDMQLVALRLRQGLISRPEAEQLYLALRGRRSTAALTADGGGTPAAAPIAAQAPSPAQAATSDFSAARSEAADLQVALWSDSSNYRAGQLMTVFAAPTKDCHLTVIGVDSAGKATVLFPNDFEQDNLVRGGRVQRIPARNSPYQLRLKVAGAETVVALCETNAKNPSNLEHDFERQRFTVLGNWRNFLNAAVEKAAEDRRTAGPAGRARVKKTRVRGESRTETKADVKSDADGRPESSVRTAIQVRVE